MSSPKQDDDFNSAFGDLWSRRVHYFFRPKVPSIRSVDGRWPDFLIIGAQKAGSTWMNANLAWHPEVWTPPIKELNFFNQYFVPSTDGWEVAN